MELELRKPLPYGYTTYTGVVALDCQVDRYNRIQADINRWQLERGYVPDHLLNESHRALVLMATP